MIILAIATQITLLQGKLNLPRHCIAKFFFTPTETIYPKKWGIPTAQIEKKVHFRLACIRQKRLCLSSLMTF